MNATDRALETVNDIASDQWGLITTAQAAARGVTRLQLSRFADRGFLERVAHGMYSLIGAEDRLEDLHIAWVACAPELLPRQRPLDVSGAVVSHESATQVHGVGVFYDTFPHFTVSTTKRTKRDVFFHVAKLRPEDIVVIEGLPVTSPERTVADLIRTRHDTEHVANILAEFTNRGTFKRAKLVRDLEPLARRNGHSSGEVFTQALERLVGLDPESKQVQALVDLTTAHNQASHAPPADLWELSRAAGAVLSALDAEMAAQRARAALALNNPALKSVLSALSSNLRKINETLTPGVLEAVATGFDNLPPEIRSITSSPAGAPDETQDAKQ